MRLSGNARPTSASSVSYLGRLLDVLDLVGAELDHPVALTEVAQQTGIPTSTAARLLNLLAERRLVRRLPTGGFVAGPQLTRIALRALDLGKSRTFDETVRSLSAATGESASVGLVMADEIVLVARCEPNQTLRAVARVGDVMSPHLTAMGKAILAYLPPPRQLEILTAAVGTGAVSILGRLDAELERTRMEGFASDEETYAAGLRCRAATILGPAGEAQGAISVSGPTSRFTKAAASRAVSRLLAEADSASLGVGTPS